MAPAHATAPQPAPLATPSCQPWQTPSALPVPTGSVGSKPAPSATPIMVCRNAPPTPFDGPRYAPEQVIGGARLGETGTITDLPAGIPMPPDTGDVSWLLADNSTGEILAAKHPHALLRPASTLKTLEAVTLMPRLDPKQVVIATKEHVAANGSRVGMVAGNPYSVAQLFEALIMVSANDAAYALADAGGGYDETVVLMNAKAKELGAFDTIVVDPSGLDEGDQRSSAYDLALMGRAALRLPAFRADAIQKTATFPGGKDENGTVQKPFAIANINDLLWNYPGTIGVKPGRTNRAQHTFIGAATRDGRTLLVVQMGSTSGSYKPTAALLDWGFAYAGQVRPVGRLVEPGTATPPTPLPPTASGVGPTATPAPSGGASSSGTALPSGVTEAPSPGAAEAPALSSAVGSIDRRWLWGGVAGVGALGVILLLVVRRRTKSP